MESCQEPKSMSKLQRTEGAAGRLSLGPAAQGVDTHTHIGRGPWTVWLVQEVISTEGKRNR